MSLNSTFTNASVHGWSALSTDAVNFPWALSQNFSPSSTEGRGYLAISGDGNYFVEVGLGTTSYITVYVKSTTWSIQQTFDTSISSAQLDGVAIDGTGSTIVVLSSGTSFIFTRSGSTWSELTTIAGGTGCAMSQDGNYIIIAEWASSQSLKIYLKSGSTWPLQQTITSPSPGTFNYFGRSPTINSDGTVLAVGEPGASADLGKAYIYSRSGTVWSVQQVIQASDGTFGDQFGSKVVLDSTGTYCVVATNYPYDYSTQGKVYVFEYTYSWDQNAILLENCGSLSVSDGAEAILIGESNTLPAVGKVTLYCKILTDWLLAEIIPSPFPTTNKTFGHSTSITNNSNTFVTNSLAGARTFVYVSTIFN